MSRPSLLILLAATLASVAAPGCAGLTTISAEEATATAGTRRYDAHDQAQVEQATRVALQSMGYEIVSDDAALPIKTAPKVVQVNASGGEGYASAASAELAWTIEIAEESGAAVIEAHPRGYFGGQAQDRYNAQWIHGAFDTLFAEIESNLSDTDA